MKCAIVGIVALASGAAWAGTPNPLDALRLDDLSATRERPLFAPTRRPPPPPRVEAAPEPAPVEVKEVAVVVQPPPFDLVGAVIGPDKAFALLRNKSTNQVVRLRSGDESEGWRIGEIGVRSVALERDGRHESLALAAPQPLAGAAQIAGEDPTQSAQPIQPDPIAEPTPPPAPGVGSRPPFVGMIPQKP